jgi:hypothetical protein
MPSHDIMVPVPIKMQPSLGILDPNNLQINTSCPHPNVIHTSPQTPNIVSFENVSTELNILILSFMIIIIYLYIYIYIYIYI